MVNLVGIHPRHFNVEPPTALMVLLHGSRLRSSISKSERCSVPAMQILAPLSGNIKTDCGLYMG